MSKKDDDVTEPGLPANLPRIYYLRFTDAFEAVQLTMPMQNTFGIQTQLTALEQEAQARDCVMIVQVALISYGDYYAVDQVQGVTDEQAERTDQP